MAADSPQALAVRFEACFSRIQQERMREIPLLNPELRVSAVGFRAWDDYVLGVLVTPWFMSLVMVPDGGKEWDILSVGDKITHRFDAGTFEFVFAREAGLGGFLSCSLFSPMFEFDSQEAAEATACEVMKALFDAGNREAFAAHSPADIREDETLPRTLSAVVLDGIEALGKVAGSKPERPISRRDLLRGSFLRPPKKIESNDRERAGHDGADG